MNPMIANPDLQTKKVRIIDLKLDEKRGNGVLYCYMQDVETGERLISAELRYIMQVIAERGHELIDANDILKKIALNFRFYKG